MPRPITSCAIIILTLGLLLLYAQIKPQTQVTIGDDTFAVTIANTQQERTTGLMNVSKLASDKGMLFEFQNSAPRSFWMKNTLIPLDIIFVDENQKIIFIHQNVQPCKIQDCPSYTSNNLSAKYVLEIKGNETLKRNIRIGDQLIIH
jgi:uncharacterized membrane protein (UPF0127 family)